MATPGEFSDWLGRMPDRIANTVGRTMVRAGRILETQIKANASGRPGPRAVTGDYRRNWQTRPGRNPLEVVVTNNSPQGRRLEYGFTDTDSRDRSYNQPPFPHVEPAIQARRDQIEDMIGDAVKEANEGPA